ncbi:hypothetical protein ACFGVR_15460 [Mucilaginibacter sp. AW1-3]
MAGIEWIPNTKVKASGILEVVIAMVVIVAVFIMAMMIFANVQRLSLTTKTIKAQGVLKEILCKARQDLRVAKERYTLDDFNIEQGISPYGDTGNLYQITLAAYDTNQEKVAEIKEIVYEVP